MVILYTKNNAAALDSSQLLLQLHFLCKKRLFTSVLAEMAVCLREYEAGFLSLTPWPRLLPCAHFLYRS